MEQSARREQSARSGCSEEGEQGADPPHILDVEAHGHGGGHDGRQAKDPVFGRVLADADAGDRNVRQYFAASA